MRTPLVTLVLAGALAAGEPSDSSSPANPGYIRYPIRAAAVSPQLQSQQRHRHRSHEVLGKREAVEQATSDIWNGMLYMMPMQIGTPPQEVVVNIDTGSDLLWVNPTCNKAQYQVQIEYCGNLTRYDSGSSSTFESSGTTDDEKYAVGKVEYERVRDTVWVNGMAIENQDFGLASSTEVIYYNMLGLGPMTAEEEAARGNSVLTSMVQKGLIGSRTFTLDLRTIDSDAGAIIFGGLDTKKYIGSLEKLPMVDPAGAPDGKNRYWVDVASISVNHSSGISNPVANGSHPYFLDSGSTVTQVPREVWEGLVAEFPTAYKSDTQDGIAVVQCSVGTQEGSVDFVFGSKTIQVAYKDIIWEQVSITSGKDNGCVLGVQPSDSLFILGASFLRAAYVVFDQDNREIHVAQAANCGTEIVAIGAGETAVPSVTGQCTEVWTAPASETGTTTSTLASRTGGGGQSATSAASGSASRVGSAAAPALILVIASGMSIITFVVALIS